MHLHIISIFPQIFESFVSTSIIARSISDGKITISLHNPRDYTHDKHQQVDDEIYGGGAGLLMKAQPIIDVLKDLSETADASKTKVVYLGPSKTVFNQGVAHEYAEDYDTLILICGRYEGIDHRVIQWCQQQYDERFAVISLGQYVTLGGETPAMVMIESIVRLLPGVISDPESRQDESYRPEHGLSNLEYPQYTRPLEVEGMSVPEVLLSGHHQKIDEWRNEQSSRIPLE